MRDPARIDPTLEAIGEFWKKYPDLRLGQLIIILAQNARTDPFYVEDDKLVQAGELWLINSEENTE